MSDTASAQNYRVPKHAIERFRERVHGMGLGFMTWTQSRAEFASCLASADAKDLATGMRKRTHYIPLGCCIAVANKGAIVTVLPRVTCPICGDTHYGEASLSRHVFRHHFHGCAGSCADTPAATTAHTATETALGR